MKNPENEKTKHPWQALKESWYDKLNVSVKQLDVVIVVCVIALVAVLAHGYINRGFVVTFDSRGGTDVASQKLVDQRYVTEPEPPTREGYVFVGWYREAECITRWHMEIDTVTGPMTLYAKWEPVP